jgi:phage terminase large subunit-like protein
MAKKTTNSAVEKYINGVENGSIAACKWVKLAVKRYLDDLKTGKGRGLRFDADAAQHAIDFYKFLRHSKGEFSGKPFELEPWQQFIIWNVFGWMKKSPDNGNYYRRFRTAYIEVARKNGKSTMLSGMGLYMLAADGEGGAEVYAAATKRDQARIVHQEATRMVASSPALRKRIKRFRDNLHVPKSSSKFEPLGRDSNSMDGLNVHCAIVDELHAHKTRDVWDLLDTATGARRQPLMLAITTAGYDRSSFCYEMNTLVKRVLEGTADDDSLFGIVFSLDDGDDYSDESCWIKANPNLGVSKNRDDLRRKLRRAKDMPSALNAFLRLELNIWTQASERWTNPEKWEACAKTVNEDDLIGRACYGGLDLSSTTDITAFVLVFPPIDDGEPYQIVSRFWIPDENMKLRSNRDGVPYLSWHQQGLIKSTPGNVIDHSAITHEIDLLAQKYDIKEIAFDRWGSVQVSQKLQESGIEIAQFGQGYQSMSPAMKNLEVLMLSEQLAHGGNPILTWMAGNMVATQDPAGNLKPDKKRSTEKIDGMVALMMALDRSVRNDTDDEPESVYESRGLRYI